MLCTLTSPTVIEIQFEQLVYSVTESDGSVRVCVEVALAYLETSVHISIFTGDGSAIGKPSMYQYYHIMATKCGGNYIWWIHNFCCLVDFNLAVAELTEYNGMT